MHQCRDAKRKCIYDDQGSSSDPSCQRCKRRTLQCSRSWLLQQKQATTRRPVAPAPPASPPAPNPTKTLEGFLSSTESVSRLVQEYMSRIHGRPHSIFHGATLWRDIREGRAGQALILSICAMGAHTVDDPALRSLEPLLTAESKRLVLADLERVCLETVQTCILVANLCVAHGNSSSEFLFFRTAVAMMQLMESQIDPENDNSTQVSHELRTRIWWALFAADNWCSFSLGVARQLKHWARPSLVLMDDCEFDKLRPDEPRRTAVASDKPGLWSYMATLTEVFAPIQELNRRAAKDADLDPAQIEQDTYDLAQRLQSWEQDLPQDVQLTERNLTMHSEQGTGGAFLGLHLGFHHYSTLLFYQYVNNRPIATERARHFAERGKYHALSYSRWLAYGRQQPGCEAIYPTVAHMATVSSSVLLQMLLFGDEDELPQTRQCLEANFEALLELEKYWPIVKTMISRLMEFQNNCLFFSHAQNRHRLDGWLLRFLFEYALPLDERPLDPYTDAEREVISTQATMFSEKGRLPVFEGV